jgi:hypothetical protein
MAWKHFTKRRTLGCLLAALSVSGIAATASAAGDPNAFELSNMASSAFFTLPGITNGTPPTIPQGTSPASAQPAGLYYLDRNNASSGGIDWIQDVGNVNTPGSNGSQQTPSGFGSWYYIGVNGGGAQGIQTLGSGAVTNQATNTLTAQYGSSLTAVEVAVTATLTGGAQGSYDSSLSRQIEIYNPSATAAVNVNFYGLTNLALTQVYNNGTSSWTVSNTSINSAKVMGGDGSLIDQQTKSPTGFVISDASDSLTCAAANPLVQVNTAGTLSSEFAGGTLTSLPSGQTSLLNTSDPSLDPAYAFMYSLHLNPGDAVVIIDTKKKGHSNYK